MIERVRSKGVTVGLTFLSLTLVLPQFLKLYGLGKTTLGIGLSLAFCLAGLFLKKPLIRLMGYLFVLSYVLYRFFPSGKFFSWIWIDRLFDHFKQFFQAVRQGTIETISAEIALTFVFAVTIFLVEQVIQKNQIVLCYSLMIAYLLLLAVYNDFDPSSQVLGLVGLALLTKGLQEKRTSEQKLVALICTLSLLAVAYFIPFTGLKNAVTSQTISLRDRLNDWGVYRYIQQTGTGIPGRTGFSEDDRKLGGPLIDDDQILFEAVQKSPHYWRVESKAVYTGSGWTYGEDYLTYMEQLSSKNVTLTEMENAHSLKDMETIQLKFNSPLSYYPLPYGKKSVTVSSDQAGFRFFWESARLDPEKPVDSVIAEIAWNDFDYELSDLRDVKIAQPDATVDYLQLPQLYSEKVSQLALELTQDKTSMLDKVLAIQEYLKFDGRFRYSKVDTDFPDSGQDYVEGFLFDSKIGYCDNFSSAMVVMLRAIGIPARWTKGFASGEVVEKSAEGDRYEIRNKNAHSWPEVFFEGYGWLPFEPTPTFSQPLEEASAVETSDEMVTTVPSTTSVRSTDSTTSMTTERTSSESSAGLASGMNWRKWWHDHASVFKKIAGVFLSLVLVMGIFFLWQNKTYLLIWLLLKKSKQAFVRGYPILLKKVEKQNPRPLNQPLLAYARTLEATWSADFRDLTKRYESLIYGENRVETDADRQLLLKTTKQVVRETRWKFKR